MYPFMQVQILTDAALLKRQRKEIEELRAKLKVCIHEIMLSQCILNLNFFIPVAHRTLKVSTGMKTF
jgi:hypothetical protein